MRNSWALYGLLGLSLIATNGYSEQAATDRYLVTSPSATGEPSPAQKMTKIDTMVSSGGAKEFSAIALLFATDSDESVRAHAANALAKFKEANNRGRILAREYEKTSSDRLRKCILTVLADVQTTDSVSLLKRVVHDASTSTELRCIALNSLNTLNVKHTPAELASLYEKASSDAFKRAIVDAIPLVKPAAQESLVTQLLSQETRAESRSDLISAIVRFKVPNAEAVLLPLLNDNNPMILLSTVRALGNLGKPQTAAPIVATYKRTYAMFQKDLTTLQRLQWENELVTALENTSPSQGTDVFKRIALDSSFSPNSVADDKRQMSIAFAAQVQQRAVENLGLSTNPDTAAWLIAAGFHTSDKLPLRIAAAKAFGQMGTLDAVAVLITMAKDPTPQVRWTAVAGLATVDSAQALSVLTESLSDDHPEVVTQAMKALSRHPNADVADAIRTTWTKHGNPGEVAEARKALQKILNAEQA